MSDDRSTEVWLSSALVSAVSPLSSLASRRKPRKSIRKTLAFSRFICLVARAALAIAEKHPESAIQILAPVEQYDLGERVSRLRALTSAYIRGLAYLQAKQSRRGSSSIPENSSTIEDWPMAASSIRFPTSASPVPPSSPTTPPRPAPPTRTSSPPGKTPTPTSPSSSKPNPNTPNSPSRICPIPPHIPTSRLPSPHIVAPLQPSISPNTLKKPVSLISRRRPKFINSHPLPIKVIKVSPALSLT